ncbi:MAG: hypothetical protein AAFN11_16655, partial [Chloroflexota bacterium]
AMYTWLYWIPETESEIEHLLAWVPPEFVKDANEAILSVAEQHIIPATQKDFTPNYKKILADNNLLAAKTGD